ncbi:tRNA-specific adenosine deaminase 1 [Latimeria chalumnae]|uniref:tRNA-specific adenosine deaminase 1 n=1 Tax=Latimeria chalumnae TaxID=7897 RepID=UPI00313BD135
MLVADEIASLCYEHYSTKLPKKGMPDPSREWTLLAAVVKVECDPGPSRDNQKVKKEVVAIGTGTKCIGQSKMSKSGDIVNDSHAEVVAKRSFQRYLYHQLELAVFGKEVSVFIPAAETGKWTLRPGISFIFFTSHTPCGDASIIPMLESEDQLCLPIVAEVMSSQQITQSNDLSGHVTNSKPQEMDACKKRKHEQNENECVEETKEDTTSCPHKKRKKTEEAVCSPEVLTGLDWNNCPITMQSAECEEKGSRNSEILGLHPSASGDEIALNKTNSLTSSIILTDIHRTGAKCVPGGVQDLQEPGTGYHHVGALRLKPGRGDMTLSLSCSDKMARWGVLGCQGALLMHYLREPVYLEAVVVGECPYSQEVLQRAIIGRCCHVTSLPDGFWVREVQLLQSKLEFKHSRCSIQRCHDPSRGRLTPCGAAVGWSAVPDHPLDVTANGYKLGVTKKALGTPQARSKICKAELFLAFKQLMKLTPEQKLPESLRDKNLKTYWDFKEAAVSYQDAWNKLRRQAFGTWVRTPWEYLQFS